jgi:hypothetical protein
MSDAEKTIIKLTALSHGKNWFQSESENNQILVRYYSIPAINDDVSWPVPPETDINFFNNPFRIIICHIEDQQYKSVFPFLIAAGTKANFFFEEVKRVLPTAHYVIVSCAMESAEDFNKKVVLMDKFIGSMRPVLGNGFFKSLVRQEIVTVSTGNMTVVTPTISLSKECEGPFASRANWNEVVEIRQKIEESSGFKAQALLGCQLFERAARSDAPFNFFLYWVAIEVLSETNKTVKIKRLLAAAYNQNISYIQNELGFEKFINMRTSLFHEGTSHDIPQDVERYIQLAFLDILRHKLGLQCLKHLEKFVSGGFDIAKLNPLATARNIALVQTGI